MQAWTLFAFHLLCESVGFPSVLVPACLFQAHSSQHHNGQDPAVKCRCVTCLVVSTMAGLRCASEKCYHPQILLCSSFLQMEPSPTSYVLKDRNQQDYKGPPPPRHLPPSRGYRSRKQLSGKETHQGSFLAGDIFPTHRREVHGWSL